MRKLTLILVALLFTVTSYAAPLTSSEHGINGEITVKYDDKMSPNVLLEGEIMELSVKIDKTGLSNQPKMYVGLFEGNKLKTVQAIDAVSAVAQYEFSTVVNLSDNLNNSYMKIFLWEQEMKPISESLILLDSLFPIIYTYDINDMLQTLTYKNSQIVYIYDDNGNLISKTIQAVSAAPIAAPQNHMILNQNIQVQNIEISEDDDLEEIENFLSLDPAVMATLVSVEFIDDAWVTTYDLSLLPADSFVSDTEVQNNCDTNE